MGHRTRTSIEEVTSAAREIGRLIKRIHPRVRFLLEGGPIVSAEDLGRVANLAPIDGYVGGSTIQRLPLQASLAHQIDPHTQALRPTEPPATHTPRPAPRRHPPRLACHPPAPP